MRRSHKAFIVWEKGVDSPKWRETNKLQELPAWINILGAVINTQQLQTSDQPS